LSALTGAGISELSTWMVAQITQGVDIQQEVIVTNARHVEELQKTATALQTASEGLENGTTGDFIAMDIRQGMYHLGNITGDISTDDLLGNIFSKFCIGK
jgi:tRNA modification GTPase